MLIREKRSAIVVTSSGMGSAPISGILPYSMSKTFSSFLAEGLNIELKNKVDVLSFQCGEVSTKLIGNKRNGFSVISTVRATGGCLRDLGTETMTYGSFVHDLLMTITPSIILQLIINYNAPRALQRYREWQVKEGK